MLAGAASCFFAYIGFDGLATAGEEAKGIIEAFPLVVFRAVKIHSNCNLCFYVGGHSCVHPHVRIPDSDGSIRPGSSDRRLLGRFCYERSHHCPDGRVFGSSLWNDDESGISIKKSRKLGFIRLGECLLCRDASLQWLKMDSYLRDWLILILKLR